MGDFRDSLTPKITSIQKFLNRQTPNLFFAGVISKPIVTDISFDLYAFKGDRHIMFWVNNATNRIQNAVYYEPGSKAQKEIVFLEEGRRIAETFAQEKYPELWNISDVRGIRLTRNEVLASCYRNSLALAERNGLRTIAFPATGNIIYGFPKDYAGWIPVKTIKEYLEPTRGLSVYRLSALTMQITCIFSLHSVFLRSNSLLYTDKRSWLECRNIC